jgi:hypothetical protein
MGKTWWQGLKICGFAGRVRSREAEIFAILVRRRVIIVAVADFLI